MAPCLDCLSLHDDLPICDLLGSGAMHLLRSQGQRGVDADQREVVLLAPRQVAEAHLVIGPGDRQQLLGEHAAVDRKSTRLNSSNPSSSNAAFCSKKKRNY